MRFDITVGLIHTFIRTSAPFINVSNNFLEFIKNVFYFLLNFPRLARKIKSCWTKMRIYEVLCRSASLALLDLAITVYISGIAILRRIRFRRT